MAKYFVEDTSLIAIADKVRTLSGETNSMSLNAMTNNINDANEQIEMQSDLIVQITDALSNACVGTNNYELVTVSQDCTNAEQARIALQSFVGANDQIVLFIREDFTSRPSESVVNNTGLVFLWFSSFFNGGSYSKHIWARWRDNELSLSYITNTAYDFVIPAETTFIKMVVR